MPDQLLTLRDVAAVLQCCEKTVRRLVDGGELRTIRFRGSVRIQPAELQAFLARKATQS